MLLRNKGLLVQAEAAASSGSVMVILRGDAPGPNGLPLSLIHTVARTRQAVILDDARQPNPFSSDGYIAQHKPRSVFGLPLVKQGESIGVIYLENNLAAGTFTPRRIAVLELLASLAAISLENARLYSDLIAENRERTRVEASLAEGQRITRTGSWRWDVRTGAVQWSAEHFRIFEMDAKLEEPSRSNYLSLVHPDDLRPCAGGPRSRGAGGLCFSA